MEATMQKSKLPCLQARSSHNKIRHKQQCAAQGSKAEVDADNASSSPIRSSRWDRAPGKKDNFAEILKQNKIILNLLLTGKASGNSNDDIQTHSSSRPPNKLYEKSTGATANPQNQIPK